MSKLPFVGSLFTNNSQDGASREIAVFITADIIPDPSKMPTGSSNSNMYQTQIGQNPVYKSPMGRQQMPDDMYYNQPPTYQAPTYQAPSGFDAPSSQFQQPSYNYEPPVNNRAPMPMMRSSEQQFQDELRGALTR